MPNAAPGILDVVGPAGDKVDVSVKDGLSCDFAPVPTNVESFDLSISFQNLASDDFRRI